MDSTRDTYYFDKYVYKIKIDIPGIHFFRNSRNDEQCNAKLNHNYRLWNGLRHVTVKEAIGSNHKLVKKIIGWREFHKENKTALKLVFSYNTVTVYYNDDKPITDLINSFIESGHAESDLSISFLKSKQIEGFQRGVIYHNNPVKKFRVHLGYLKLDPQQRSDLTSYLIQNREAVLFGASFNRWYQSNTLFVNYSLYFDIDDDIHVTYLMLKFPGLVRKLSNIEKRINTIL